MRLFERSGTMLCGENALLLYMARQRDFDYRWIIVFNVGMVHAKECNVTLARFVLCGLANNVGTGIAQTIFDGLKIIVANSTTSGMLLIVAGVRAF
jgi:hypothetical protein